MAGRNLYNSNRNSSHSFRWRHSHRSRAPSVQRRNPSFRRRCRSLPSNRSSPFLLLAPLLRAGRLPSEEEEVVGADFKRHLRRHPLHSLAGVCHSRSHRQGCLEDLMRSRRSNSCCCDSSKRRFSANSSCSSCNSRCSLLPPHRRLHHLLPRRTIFRCHRPSSRR